ncbi:MAG: CPBP family glutamic-type intramembrane protease [Dehalococcoidia bacterium]
MAPLFWIVGSIPDLVLTLPAIMVGVWLGANVGLGTRDSQRLLDHRSSFRRWRRTTLPFAATLGLAATTCFFLIDLGFFIHLRRNYPLVPVYGPTRVVRLPPSWTGCRAAIGAAIREEIWFRLGVMTTMIWLGFKLFRRHAQGAVIWTAIVLAALLFGAIHPPQTFPLFGRSPAAARFVLLGNGLAGAVFGWLYWRRGLASAMLAR